MTQDNLEARSDASEEPPDPDPRNLTYILNGRGSPDALFRVADAYTSDGRHYVKKVENPQIVYEQREDDSTDISQIKSAVDSRTSVQNAKPSQEMVDY
jgi:hypothetical protein